MNANRKHGLLPILAALAVTTACSDARTNGASPLAPLGPEGPATSIATAASFHSPGATFAGPVNLVREAGRPEVVPVPLGDFSLFQDPFTLHIEKTGDDADNPFVGFILLDGEPFLEPADFAGAGPSLQVPIPLEPGSTLDIQLLAPVGASVTAWVEAEIQPAPTIQITSPARGAMLQAGTTGVDPVQISGQACHPVYPITSLVIDGQNVPTSGVDLCESFQVTQQSAWGTSIIRGEVENSRGRRGTVVQSYLRSPAYGVAALAPNPAARIPGGFLAHVNQPALDDSDPDLDDIASISDELLTAASLASFEAMRGAVLHDECSNEVFGVCLLHPKVTIPGIPVFSDLRVAIRTLSQTLEVRGTMVDLDVPLRVQDLVTGLAVVGDVKAESVVVTANFGTDAGGFSATSAHASVHDLTIDVQGLPPVLDDLVTSIVQSLLLDTIKDALEQSTTQVLDDVLEDVLELEVEASTSVLGRDFSIVAGVDQPSVHQRSVRLGLSPQVYPTTPVLSPPASPYGPIALGASPPALGGSPDVTLGARDDVANQLMWAAWQARLFEVADAEAFIGADVPGVSGVSVISHLPPVVTHGSSPGTAVVGWGDIEIGALVDPAVLGLPGSGASPIAITAYVSGFATLALGFDEPTQTVTASPTGASIQVQLVSSTDLLDEAATSAAIEALLADVTGTYAGAVMVAAPIPDLDYGVPGVTTDVGFRGTTLDRAIGWTTMGGAIEPTPAPATGFGGS